MNDLFTPLLWSALQVTLVAAAALVCTQWMTRRAPATAARLTTLALLASSALTVLAFCPLPSVWNWITPRITATAESPPFAAPANEAARAAPDNDSARAKAEPPSESHGGIAVNRWWQRLRGAAGPVMQADERGPSWLAVLFLGGGAAGLVRLLCGVWAVQRCRRRSAPVADLEWRQLLDRLCAAIGVAAAVELRESPDVAAPATVGWLRPAVLLPADWRTWTAADRRAVLAHELAHVYRRDYLAWLLARFVLAVCFYHPLLYWLAARLRLQQELAADALGAEHAGAAAYLRTLARLALRQDERHTAGPTLAFLSSPGTLLRRIAMLRATDGRPHRLLPRGVRAAGFMFLIAVAIGASALRAPAEKPDAQAPRSSEAAAMTAQREPFDLTYLAADAKCVLAFRPVAVFGRPEMKSYSDQVNNELAEFQHQLNPEMKTLLKIEDVEWIVCSGVLRTDPRRKDGQTELVLHMLVIRSVKDCDWKALLTALLGEVKEVQIEGETCYQPLNGKPMTILGVPPAEGCFYVPDRRTVVIDGKDALAAMFRARRQKAPPASWLRDWEHVSRGLVALAATDMKELERRGEPDPVMPPELRESVRNSTSLVVGLDWNDGPVCQAILHAADEAAAGKVVAAVKECMTRARKALDEAAENDKAEEFRIGRAALLDLVTKYEVRRDGAVVRWRSSAKAPLEPLLKALLAEELDP